MQDNFVREVHPRLRFFVTGATGHIGRHFLRQLEGHEVLCLSRSPLTGLPTGKTQWVSGSLLDRSVLAAKLEQFAPDVVVHLAWQGLPDYSKETCDQNVKLSLNLLSELLRSSVKRIVVAGSGFEYESKQGELLESMKVDSISDYANAKLAILDEFNRSCESADIDLVWSRIFCSYGPGKPASSLLPFVYRALMNREIPILKSPSSTQDFIFVDDVASALFKLATVKSVKGVVNIGSGSLTSVAKIVNLIAESCDSDYRIVDYEWLGGPWASIEKIKRLTGWEPRFTVEQGVKASINDLKGVTP